MGLNEESCEQMCLCTNIVNFYIGMFCCPPEFTELSQSLYFIGQCTKVLNVYVTLLINQTFTVLSTFSQCVKPVSISTVEQLHVIMILRTSDESKSDIYI